ncbi:hypothetical protein HID58_034172 [Brassica napus]|uniref:Uncharacterized protein n=1 Tax=Brassica napus TaxID=3708 RepID=A0ABQ8C368_BRANA|nr:hypothetical protein HID58_034172 [Brassica napus]
MAAWQDGLGFDDLLVQLCKLSNKPWDSVPLREASDSSSCGSIAIITRLGVGSIRLNSSIFGNMEGSPYRKFSIFWKRARFQGPNSGFLQVGSWSVPLSGTRGCGSHGSGSSLSGRKSLKFTYIWVGNSETKCPRQCAWPFHAPVYGPQSPPLVAPNNDVGLDGMRCEPGVHGAGSSHETDCHSYAGELLVDATTGGSYTTIGVSDRKYLLPALFDLETSSCSTLI